MKVVLIQASEVEGHSEHDAERECRRPRVVPGDERSPTTGGKELRVPIVADGISSGVGVRTRPHGVGPRRTADRSDKGATR